ncbi:MAG: type II secretion system F family protein [Actinomycetota bacterium]|nr:type II secretion system F family protein [Actinomycetota bacterium]
MAGVIGPAMASAAVLAAVGAAGVRYDPAVSKRIEALRPEGTQHSGGGMARWVGSRSWARRLGHRDELASKLATAGWRVDPDAAIGWKVIAGSAGFVLGLSAPMPLLVMTPLLVAAGFRGLDFLVSRAARRRSRQADQEVPQLLDVLAAGSTAGLAAPLALRRASAAVREPLAGELRHVLDAVDMGARWRDELRAMADRLGLPDLKRAVLAVARTEMLGSSLAEALRELAEDVRDARRARAAETARKAPVKMLFPLVFMVLPAFLLLTVVPVLFATLRSIG